MSAIDLRTEGTAAYKNGQFEIALDYYNKALQLAPQDYLIYSNRSACYANMFQYEKALADAETCIQLNPHFIKGYQRKALAYFYQQKYEDAMKTYQEGLKYDPNNFALLDGIRQTEEKLKFVGYYKKDFNPLAEALKNPNFGSLISVLKKDPRTAEFCRDQTFLELICILVIRPDFAFQKMEKEAKFEVVLDVIEESNIGQKMFYRYFENRKKQKQQINVQEGEKEKKERLEKEEKQKQEMEQQKLNQKLKEEAEQLKQQGNEFYKQKNFEESLKFYDQAITKNPKEALYYNNKAACYIEMKDYDSAIDQCQLGLQIMIEMNSNDFVKKGKLYARMGRAYYLKRDLAKCVELMEKSLVEDNNQSIRDELIKIRQEKKEKDRLDYINPQLGQEHFKTGKKLLKEKNFPEAVKEFDEACRRDPKQSTYFYKKGKALAEMSELEKGIAEFDKCLALEPKYIKAYTLKGQCYMKLDEWHRAEMAFSAGLEHAPHNTRLLQGQSEVKKMIVFEVKKDSIMRDKAIKSKHDPEIQNYLREPEILNILEEWKTNPHKAMDYLIKNPTLGNKVERLIAAGILQEHYK